MEDEDMLALVTGKLDPQKAFMSGKLKIKGNIMLTQKLKPLLSARPKVDLTKPQWNIKKDGKVVSTWTLDLKNGPGSVYRGTPKNDKPDCTFILEDDIFTKIMDGSEDPQRAFMSGKLKITGNVLASQKLQAIWENPEEEDEKMSFAPYKGEEPPIAMKADFVFEAFAERLHEEPELAQKIKVVYHWNVLQSGKKGSEWTVDLKSGSGSIYRGPPKSGKADVTLTMEDEDVILMMLGKLNPQRAFMTGRLKIKGNIMLTQKLNQLWQEILKSGRAVELPVLSAILGDKPFDPTLRSETSFVELGKRVSRQPELITKLNTVFEWNVTKDGKKKTQWILDLKSDKVMLCRGPAKEGVKPTISITIDDDVFADWIQYKKNPNQVLSDKGTKIEGDASVVSKLFDNLKVASKL
ncbi:Peroxisomal multifunctional enzyme type 2 like protein [Argiope bruennichi]|uniref:Peroxisomal multifunctional enzyme type 2 like protein n=1 Tax=Argiope bruennichi TaxID=94029 RepID=A0A8T0FVD8_ARGBR|nr:Peroxisomal multifunctional enzyme type 2 like protein [Argiope bruennichi]